VRLLIQPAAGTKDLLKAINSAKRSIDALIFRFDQQPVEQAMANAVRRGVAVSALIASTNSAGEDGLRGLEQRLLSYGITVARTDNDLVRYHGKMLIIDRRELYLLGFNWTHADMERSRSFGVITTARDAVQEAVRLFEADSKRIPFELTARKLVVSPLNARHALSDFLRGAKKSLVIYDPQVTDRAMMRILEECAAKGVEVRIIGRCAGKIPGVKAQKLRPLRLHTRTMVRDGNQVFLGSQSLRKAELDARREIGMIFRDSKIAGQILRCFESDWTQAERAQEEGVATKQPAAALAKKVAKAVAKELPPVAPIVTGAVEAVVGEIATADLTPERVEDAVKDAVKEAVREAVRDVMEGVLGAGREPAA
jgi:phosphatidylserine/phosphatidylglycerophosphate/cardiolipin synthase-like enzyme